MEDAQAQLRALPPKGWRQPRQARPPARSDPPRRPPPRHRRRPPLRRQEVAGQGDHVCVGACEPHGRLRTALLTRDRADALPGCDRPDPPLNEAGRSILACCCTSASNTLLHGCEGGAGNSSTTATVAESRAGCICAESLFLDMRMGVGRRPRSARAMRTRHVAGCGTEQTAGPAIISYRRRRVTFGNVGRSPDG